MRICRRLSLRSAARQQCRQCGKNLERRRRRLKSSPNRCRSKIFSRRRRLLLRNPIFLRSKPRQRRLSNQSRPHSRLSTHLSRRQARHGENRRFERRKKYPLKNPYKPNRKSCSSSRSTAVDLKKASQLLSTVKLSTFRRICEKKLKRSSNA